MNSSIQPLNSLWLHSERGLGFLILCGLGGRHGGLGENGTKEIKKANNIDIRLGQRHTGPLEMGLAGNTSCVPSLSFWACAGLTAPPWGWGGVTDHITQMHSSPQGTRHVAWKPVICQWLSPIKAEMFTVTQESKRLLETLGETCSPHSGPRSTSLCWHK